MMMVLNNVPLPLLLYNSLTGHFGEWITRQLPFKEAVLHLNQVFYYYDLYRKQKNTGFNSKLES